MTETILTAVEIAKLTAMLTGGGFKRANSKDAAIKRFYTVADEMGVARMNADQVITAGAFDAARDCLERHITHKARSAALTEAKPAKAKAETGKVGRIVQPKQAEKPMGKRAAEIASAEAGVLPVAPDFSANTHKPFRKKLADLVGLVAAADIDALKAFVINPISSSPKALDKYRNLAVMALSAQAASAKGGKRMTEMTSDEWNDKVIAEAVEFTAWHKGQKTLRFGTDAMGDAGAREAAIKAAEAYGVGSIVYAINGAGRQALVTTITGKKAAA